MKIDRLEHALPNMSEKALVRFVRRSVCQALMGAGKEADEGREVLDLVYVECSRRGKEKLYDTVYASISQNPEHCNLH
ncbi:MAG: hypothetical protein L3J88_09835 [Gammaproteobacteria bacterium]|nr:hypothetical protein [Gammaproteobacteria bacterium]MCF6363621.1 hypothetical protein [Gammaproteobacteria bacterium]